MKPEGNWRVCGRRHSSCMPTEEGRAPGRYRERDRQEEPVCGGRRSSQEPREGGRAPAGSREPTTEVSIRYGGRCSSLKPYENGHAPDGDWEPEKRNESGCGECCTSWEPTEDGQAPVEVRELREEVEQRCGGRGPSQRPAGRGHAPTKKREPEERVKRDCGERCTSLELMEDGRAPVEVREPRVEGVEEKSTVRPAGCGHALASAQELWPKMWSRSQSPGLLEKGHAPVENREHGGERGPEQTTPEPGEYGRAPNVDWALKRGGHRRENTPMLIGGGGASAEGWERGNGVDKGMASWRQS